VFPVVELGESKSIRVGQTVVAIGYSLGEFANSISKGIVSGLGRSILAGSAFGRTERLSDIIQTDAAINPGNSGGPLLDIYGRVIGVNVAVAQDAENVGFALPIDPVRDIIKQVQETGEIATPFLGVRYMIVDEYIARENNLDFDYGALVLRGTNRSDLAVVPGSPADKASIEENDIILEISGEKITEEMPLESIISQYNVGDEVTLKIWSEGKTREETVTLDKRS
jgi:S1-C subfamily serine protease